MYIKHLHLKRAHDNTRCVHVNIFLTTFSVFYFFSLHVHIKFTHGELQTRSRSEIYNEMTLLLCHI